MPVNLIQYRGAIGVFNYKKYVCVNSSKFFPDKLFPKLSFQNLLGLLLTNSIFLTILIGKTCALLNSAQKFIEIQGWLLLTLFICLHNQLSSFNYIIVQISEKRDSSNKQWKWMIAFFSKFYGKIWVGFCRNVRKHFF